jgi:hypothetical protein
MAEPRGDGAARRRPGLLVFVHIPKTAGSTLRSVLNMNEPGSRSRALGNVFKGSGGIDGTLMTRLRAGDGPGLSGVGIVRGHFPLGIREYLPNLTKRKELRCFTFLREPIDRTLSHYFAIRDRREGEQEAGKYADSPLPLDSTLDDALAGGYLQDNLQTRMLCGDPEPFGEVTEEMLEAAKRNVRNELVFFGLTERFDESLVLAKRRLGLRSIAYRSSGRVNSARPRGTQIPADLRRAAERCNRYDVELYRYVKELFEEQLAPRDLEFEVDLAALDAAKSDGDKVKTPVPSSFGGDDEAWRMLVTARATGQLLEQKLAGAASRAATDRARTRVLKREVERREAAPERMVELEKEVERLREAASRAAQLEREVERLRKASARQAGDSDHAGAPKGNRAASKPARSEAGPRTDGDQKPRRARRPKREGKPRRRKPRSGVATGGGTDGAEQKAMTDDG